MEREIKHQLLGYLEKIDRLHKQLSALRQRLTNLIYCLPKDETPSIELPKERGELETTYIAEVLSSSPSRYKRRSTKLKIDDFMDALEKFGMSVGHQLPLMAHMIGAKDGCGVEVNGVPISVYQYDTSLATASVERNEIPISEYQHNHSLEDIYIHGNLVIIRESEHKDWDSILKVFKSL